MSRRSSPVAVAEALLVTLLWSSSYVLIKIGLKEIAPLGFAAVRYALGFLILLVALALQRGHSEAARWPRRVWYGLIAMGLSGYTLAQGLNFVGLVYLPAVTTTFLLNFTPLFVVFLGVAFLAEVPSLVQAVGIVVALAGALVYFGAPPSTSELVGIFVVFASGLAWAGYLVLVRAFQRVRAVGSLRLTTITMGIGSAGLLVSALSLEGVPSISPLGWVIIVWLGAVNTALAFYLWNRVLKSLRAFELSMLQNTMLIQIALLAWFFLGEQITGGMILGIILVLLGVALVQIPVIKGPRARQKPI